MTVPAAEGAAVYSSQRTAGVARAMGLDGAPAPAWVKSDVTMFRAYKSGLDEHHAAQSPTGFHPPPGRPKRKKPARTRPAQARGGSRRPGYLSRAFSPSRAAGRLGGTKLMRAGDGGGLLLALVVYPLLLATIQNGAKGPGMWFRAKWLNQGLDGGTGGPKYHHRGDKNTPQPKPGRIYYKIAPDGKGYIPVDPNGKRIPGGVEIPRLLPGMHLLPSGTGPA